MVILGETLRVVDTVYGTVHGTVCAAGSHRTLVFTPQFPLQPGTCEVEVTTGGQLLVRAGVGATISLLF
ncbi:MAG: hypothetical protein DDT30_00067 [Dehalococcoidia bacterium]|nr:hypothetical protein [Bacillota bacterium]